MFLFKYLERLNSAHYYFISKVLPHTSQDLIQTHNHIHTAIFPAIFYQSTLGRHCQTQRVPGISPRVPGPLADLADPPGSLEIHPT